MTSDKESRSHAAAKGKASYALAEKYAKKYAATKVRMEQAYHELADMEEKSQSLPACAERTVIQDIIEKKKRATVQDRADVLIFESALMRLNPSEKSVLTQLFIQGKRWAEVVGTDGLHMSYASICRLRVKGLKQIEATIREYLSENSSP